MNTHDQYMKMALELARKGNGRVAPNPLVGCIIVKDGRVIGSGYHERYGGPHAEINALARAGNEARGSTLYVTLEPCSHWGKTPPCADALIKAGVSCVVSAMKDPNPVTSGKGFKKLRENGIKVISGILERQARRLNDSYIRMFKDRTPKVIIKSAMSLDGKIASFTGDSKWITGPAARRHVHEIRSSMDGILVGVNTVIRDNPHLTSHGKGRNPVRIILDPRLRIPVNSRVLDRMAPTLLIHSSDRESAKLKRLRNKGAIPLYLKSKMRIIDFKDIIKKLTEISIYKILIEGGGKTIATALDAGVVDEAIFFIAPKIIGGSQAPTPVEGKGIARIANAIPLKNIKTKRIGKDILISARIAQSSKLKAKSKDKRH